MNNEIIITERLIIRELTIGDLIDFYKLENDPQVRKYIPNMYRSTFNECRDNLRKHINKYSYNSGLHTWGVVLEENKEFIGITGYRYLKDLNAVEIGIRLLPDYWSKGYATESGKALLTYGFTELGLKEIIAMALPENKKSMKSLENIGMEFEGYGYFRGSLVAYFKKERYNFIC
ncbi:GNAT family N-acetyltransferase [Sedimentibacter sp. zth1]|uniref:GNAT family N-acetyltransferase n=1 Tax=Sedimentibacter sp. zth1 TaxID=2816908 RepID=UPI001A91CF8E|nr:GNAT family N-acetyltransferase [Sedimentibacter sp. zth1]QSX06938.1 GNAT family N-acetyltransferase [Sedimentibacter sp. zth1]